MPYWPGFTAAREVIELYIHDNLKLPSKETDCTDKEFKRICDMQWAAKDLLEYLKEFWFMDSPLELISDYIYDCRYRSEKYEETVMGAVYKTAELTAEDIMLLFV